MRVLLLVNSTASSVTARKRVPDPQDPRREARRRGRGDVAPRPRRAASRAPRPNDGFDVVAVLAGDGTLNEAADGLLHTDTALAPLPGGSTNVYAQTLGIPARRRRRGRARCSRRSTRGSIERVGVGLANDRPFLFYTGRRLRRGGDPAGRAAQPLAQAHARRIPLHVAAAFADVLPRRRPPHAALDIAIDDRRRTIAGVRFAIVSKTTPYTYLGRLPLDVAPKAGSTRALSLTAFRALKALTLLGGAASAMRTGKFLRDAARTSCTLDDLGRLRVRRRHAVPVPGRRRRPVDDVEDARHRLRARRARRSCCRSDV